jgi:hypothetical protein
MFYIAYAYKKMMKLPLCFTYMKLCMCWLIALDNMIQINLNTGSFIGGGEMTML